MAREGHTSVQFGPFSGPPRSATVPSFPVFATFSWDRRRQYHFFQFQKDTPITPHHLHHQLLKLNGLSSPHLPCLPINHSLLLVRVPPFHLQLSLLSSHPHPHPPPVLIYSLSRSSVPPIPILPQNKTHPLFHPLPLRCHPPPASRHASRYCINQIIPLVSSRDKTFSWPHHPKAPILSSSVTLPTQLFPFCLNL